MQLFWLVHPGVRTAQELASDLFIG